MNKPEKLDYERLGEDFIPDNGGIALSLRTVETPVFYVSRHGRFKKCFSVSAAINNLAHFMAQKVFDRMGKPSRSPSVRIDRDDLEVWRKGEVLPAYWKCHARAMRRIRLILRKKRAIEKWQKDYIKLSIRTAEFMKKRPY